MTDTDIDRRRLLQSRGLTPIAVAAVGLGRDIDRGPDDIGWLPRLPASRA